MGIFPLASQSSLSSAASVESSEAANLMASIRGDKQEIKPGFFCITRDVEEGKALAFFNETPDIQFNVCYALQNATVTALGQTQVGADSKYAVTVYPGETKEFIKGKWSGCKKSISFGSPDKAWQEKQAAVKNKEIEDEIAALKELVKQHPRPDGKYTVEYISGLCIQYKVKFVDLTFPPRATSIARDWEDPISGTYSWLRPNKFCPKDKPPQLFVGKIEPNDIDQGILGDCYFLCSLACIAEFPLLIRDVFSLQQYPELGIYRLLVCKNGWWQTVIVDDYIPCRNGVPCFAKNREEPNELWASLLEKAYAKLHGSYSAIRSGDASQAIADILGAPFMKLKSLPEFDDKEKLFELLKKNDEDEHLMSLGTPGKDYGEAEAAKDELALQYEQVGLATGHAYSLLRVKRVSTGHRLCMIRNPWGNDKEWNGAWSDDSPLWTPALQEEVGFYKGNDGTFWMAWEDVIKFFDGGSISKVMRDWVQLRVAANFEKGVADLVMLITVKDKPVECFFGCHQRDQRGLPSGDKDSKYIGMLLSVLREKEQANAGCDKVAESNNGAFSDVRDMFATCTLQPSSKPYVVLVQPFAEDACKSFTISMTCNDPSPIQSIVFRTNSNKKRYIPSTRLLLSDWTQKAAADYQLRHANVGGKEGMNLATLQGEMVDIKVMCGKTVVAEHTPDKVIKEAGVPAPPVATKAVAGSPAAAPVSPASKQPAATEKKPSGKGERKSGIKLQLLVLSGRNLPAKDRNGLSDPYVTVKLKTAGGDHVANDQRQETRYLKETLNPVWCESFNFLCSPEDVLCVKCWDKDMMGHDMMGVVNLSVKDILKRLVQGGPGEIGWFPLAPPPDDAKGELQLGISLL